jgi:hypothetical protein
MARPSAVERVRTALIDRDEALQQARGDLEKARTVAADWEADVVSVRAQHRQVRELDGELIALSNSNADQHRTLEDQRATVVSLQLVVEGRRQALEGERKQVEGELSFRSFVLLIFPSAVCSLLDLLCSWYPSLRTALGRVTDRAETLQAAYDSAERELVELRAAALETCQTVEEGEARAGSSLASRLRALGGHVSRCMRRALHLGVQKALGVLRSHYEVNFEAVVSGYVVPDGVEEHMDALAAVAAERLTEDFMEFLFPDVADADAPQTCRPLGTWPFFVQMLVSGPRGCVNEQVFW